MRLRNPFHRPEPQLVYCPYCRELWHPQAMNTNTLGLYVCRACNPDPGPPHDAQTPNQHARSLRYEKAKTDRRHRCAECGTKIRRYGWSPGLDNPLPHEINLCEHCIGPERDDIHKWFGYELVRG